LSRHHVVASLLVRSRCGLDRVAPYQPNKVCFGNGQELARSGQAGEICEGKNGRVALSPNCGKLLICALDSSTVLRPLRIQRRLGREYRCLQLLFSPLLVAKAGTRAVQRRRYRAHRLISRVGQMPKSRRYSDPSGRDATIARSDGRQNRLRIDLEFRRSSNKRLAKRPLGVIGVRPSCRRRSSGRSGVHH